MKTILTQANHIWKLTYTQLPYPIQHGVTSTRVRLKHISTTPQLKLKFDRPNMDKIRQPRQPLQLCILNACLFFLFISFAKVRNENDVRQEKFKQDMLFCTKATGFFLAFGWCIIIYLTKMSIPYIRIEIRDSRGKNENQCKRSPFRSYRYSTSLTWYIYILLFLIHVRLNILLVRWMNIYYFLFI